MKRTGKRTGKRAGLFFLATLAPTLIFANQSQAGEYNTALNSCKEAVAEELGLGDNASFRLQKMKPRGHKYTFNLRVTDTGSPDRTKYKAKCEADRRGEILNLETEQQT